MRKILALFSILLSMFVIDFIWLGVLMNDFYMDNLGLILLDEYNILPLVLFYIFYCVSVLFVAVIPSNSYKNSAYYGAWLGFCSYMTFDLVNYGLIDGWPSNVVVIDIIWGTILTATISVIGFATYKKLENKK